MIIIIPKKRLQLIILAVVSAILLIISLEAGKAFSHHDAYKPEVVLLKKVTTESYSIMLPKNWKVKEFHGGTTFLDFYIRSRKVGWLVKSRFIDYGYDYDIVDSRKVEGFTYETLMVDLVREKPSAPKGSPLIKETHFFISDGEGTDVYDLGFYSQYVSEAVAKEIARSFKIK